MFAWLREPMMSKNPQYRVDLPAKEGCGLVAERVGEQKNNLTADGACCRLIGLKMIELRAYRSLGFFFGEKEESFEGKF